MWVTQEMSTQTKKPNSDQKQSSWRVNSWHQHQKHPVKDLSNCTSETSGIWNGKIVTSADKQIYSSPPCTKGPITEGKTSASCQEITAPK